MSAVTANGIQIEVEEHGRAEDPAFLMIRGLSTQLVQWPGRLLQALCDAGFRVVTFDNRDVGLSQKFDVAGTPDIGALLAANAGGEMPPVPYRLDDMAADAVGVLDALGIESAHVVGMSMGGMIAQILAAENGARCLSLTSVMSSSGAPGLPPPTPEAMESLISQPADPSDPECVLVHAMRTQRVIGSPAFPVPDDELRRYFEVAYERCYSPMGSIRQMAAVLANGSRVGRLEKIRVPTLVLHGSADPLVPLACGEDTARHIPGARLEVIEGMGHDVNRANSPRVAELLIAHARAAQAGA